MNSSRPNTDWKLCLDESVSGSCPQAWGKAGLPSRTTDTLDSDVSSNTGNPKNKTLRDCGTDRKQQVRETQKTKHAEEGSEPNGRDSTECLLNE